MDFKRLKERYGDRGLFFGNMDCGKVLSFSAPKEIRALTYEILYAGWGSGGHIFRTSNAITASVPLATYLARVYAYREKHALPSIKSDNPRKL